MKEILFSCVRKTWNDDQVRFMVIKKIIKVKIKIKLVNCYANNTLERCSLLVDTKILVTLLIIVRFMCATSH